jgi:hypothetical protein
LNKGDFILNSGLDIFKDGNVSTFSLPEEDFIGTLKISDLLQKPFEKHIGSFEIPFDIKQFLDADEINASITWYLNWKLSEPMETQNTCTIKKLFGFLDGTRVIIAINLYKYLRNKGYDPEIIDRFITNTINKK